MRERARLDGATAFEAAHLNPDGTRGLGPGFSGRIVRNIQAHLVPAGLAANAVTGRWDGRTTSAVRSFQKRTGLAATGRVDFATWSKLKTAYVATLESVSRASGAGAD